MLPKESVPPGLALAAGFCIALSLSNPSFSLLPRPPHSPEQDRPSSLPPTSSSHPSGSSPANPSSPPTSPSFETSDHREEDAPTAGAARSHPPALVSEETATCLRDFWHECHASCSDELGRRVLGLMLEDDGTVDAEWVRGRWLEYWQEEEEELAIAEEEAERYRQLEEAGMREEARQLALLVAWETEQDELVVEFDTDDEEPDESKPEEDPSVSPAPSPSNSPSHPPTPRVSVEPVRGVTRLFEDVLPAHAYTAQRKRVRTQHPSREADGQDVKPFFGVPAVHQPFWLKRPRGDRQLDVPESASPGSPVDDSKDTSTSAGTRGKLEALGMEPGGAEKVSRPEQGKGKGKAKGRRVSWAPQLATVAADEDGEEAEWSMKEEEEEEEEEVGWGNQVKRSRGFFG